VAFSLILQASVWCSGWRLGLLLERCADAGKRAWVGLPGWAGGAMRRRNFPSALGGLDPDHLAVWYFNVMSAQTVMASVSGSGQSLMASGRGTLAAMLVGRSIRAFLA